MTIFLDDRNAGIVPGARQIITFGQNSDVDQATVPEDIWQGGGTYSWMTGATSLEIVSSSANDAAAGTGMRTVQLTLLDINYAETVVAITLNGVTPVAISGQWFRINRAVILTAGSGGTNAGTITIRDAGAGTTRRIIPVGAGADRDSAYTVPAGKTLLINNMTNCINRPTTARDAVISLFIRFPNGASFLSSDISVDGNPFQRAFNPPIAVPEKYDTIFRSTYVSTDNTDITSQWLGILRDN